MNQQHKDQTTKRRGARPTPPPAGRGHLAAEWQHLRAWWAVNGRLYSVSAIADEVGLSKGTVSRLLAGTGRDAATAARFDAIVAVLKRKYEPLIENNSADNQEDKK